MTTYTSTENNAFIKFGSKTYTHRFTGKDTQTQTHTHTDTHIHIRKIKREKTRRNKTKREGRG